MSSNPHIYHFCLNNSRIFFFIQQRKKISIVFCTLLAVGFRYGILLLAHVFLARGGLNYLGFVVEGICHCVWYVQSYNVCLLNKGTFQSISRGDYLICSQFVHEVCGSLWSCFPCDNCCKEGVTSVLVILMSHIRDKGGYVRHLYLEGLYVRLLGRTG